MLSFWLNASRSMYWYLVVSIIAISIIVRKVRKFGFFVKPPEKVLLGKVYETA
jgi:hypothetical protein